MILLNMETLSCKDAALHIDFYIQIQYLNKALLSLQIGTRLQIYREANHYCF